MRRRDKNRPDIRALRHVGLDAVLGRHRLEQLAAHTDVIDVSRGEVLARAGHFARQFVAVIEGIVDVTDRSGRTHVAGPGTQIGGAELLNRTAHQETFVTRSDCRIVVIFGRALASTFQSPAVASWVEQHSASHRRLGTTTTPPATRTLVLVD